MRLAFIFLLVLGLSVILVSMASWGITYSSSYARVRAMAKEFTQLARSAVDHFGGLVGVMIQDSWELVRNVTQTEFLEGNARIDQTERQTRETTKDLIQYATNATVHSQQDIEELVQSFEVCIKDIIDDFEEVAARYASQLRLETAIKVKAKFGQWVHERVLALQRFGFSYDLGLLNMTRNPEANITESDCTLLAAVCGASRELTYSGYLFLGTATGALYSCNDDDQARILVNSFNGTSYVQTLLLWTAPGNETSSSNRRPWKQRCMQGTTQYKQLSDSCSNPWSCKCGYDVRCRRWYRNQVGVAPQIRVTEPYVDFLGMGILTISFPVLNYLTDPPTLVAVMAAELHFSSVNNFLVSLNPNSSMVVAVIRNDTNLTIVGNNFQNRWMLMEDEAGGAEMVNCSTLYLTNACDPPLRPLARWLLSNRETLHSHATTEIDGIVWDVFFSTVDMFSYFVLVGMNKTEIYGVITASEETASHKLQVLRTQQIANLLEADAKARAHMAAAEQQNLQALQEMKRTLEQQLKDLQVISQAALNASQQRSTMQLRDLMQNQLEFVEQLQQQQLSILASNVGWTLAVVVATFMIILLLGAYGTISVTKSLTKIIKVMEDVAQMHIEALHIPKGSLVTEVDRIQSAFQTMVHRLAFYKSFMPAGLFQEQDARGNRELPKVHAKAAAPPTPHSDEPQFHRIIGQAPPRSRSLVQIDTASSATTLSTRPTMSKRNIAALVVNVMGFRANVFHSAEGHIEALLNQYVAIVHETISKGRGNIDAIIGDQVMVTFNAHIVCTDAMVAAATAALELQKKVIDQMSALIKTQVGLTGGRVFAGSSGYGPFKSMVSIGTPMKLACMLAHLTQFEEPVVLADPGVEERVKFGFKLRPVDLVYLPLLGSFAPALSRNVRVYAVQSRKDIRDDEWLYQVGNEEPMEEWERTFNKMASAETVKEAEDALSSYVTSHPDDTYAVRMKLRMKHWQPRHGLPLCEGPDYRDIPSHAHPLGTSMSP